MARRPAGTPDISLSFPDGRGASWSTSKPVADQLRILVDRFNQWLAVDSVTGDVNLSFYDTRNDTTGQRFQTDVFFTQSADGGLKFRSPNVRVTDVSSNEHDCSGLFPCPGIDYGNQQGDYEGLASLGGVAHPICTDRPPQPHPPSAPSPNPLLAEVSSATANPPPKTPPQ